jgi:hypothetical protein
VDEAGVDEAGVDEAGVDEAGVDEAGVDEAGAARTEPASGASKVAPPTRRRKARLDMARRCQVAMEVVICTIV